MIAPLEGVRVIETASAMAGPMTGRLLADWGADVIHIEHPARGDVSRVLQSQGSVAGRAIKSNIKYSGENINRNKRGMTLDISRDMGLDVLYQLLKKADIFISNFRPNELEKFKLGYDTLNQVNQKLIQAHLTGYGRRGPDKDLPAYEPSAYFSRSGIVHLVPMPGSHPFGLGDNVAGLALAYGILLALINREKTGRGQEVDASLFQTGVFAISYDISGALVSGQDRQPLERNDIPAVLANTYETKDGRWIRLAMPQPDLYWSRFCRAIEREDLEHDSRFASFVPRLENHSILFDILEEVFRSKTLEEWKTRLNDGRLSWAPVQNLLEVIQDPQARENDFFLPFNHPTYGNIELVANPVKLDQNVAPVRLPAPEFSQHTEEILLEHGYSWDDISNLKKNQVIF